MSDKKRIRFDLPPAVMRQWANVKTKSQSSTVVGAVRKSVALYELVLDHGAAGGKVVLMHADGTQETLRLL